MTIRKLMIIVAGFALALAITNAIVEMMIEKTLAARRNRILTEEILRQDHRQDHPWAHIEPR